MRPVTSLVADWQTSKVKRLTWPISIDLPPAIGGLRRDSMSKRKDSSDFQPINVAQIKKKKEVVTAEVKVEEGSPHAYTGYLYDR